MTVSILIATYNSPDYLRLVLESVRQQTVLPDEVVIADDGSGEDTRRLIERYQQDFPVPIRHVWHEDRGFRLAEIRNKAIRATTAEYILQIDGDIVLEKHFVQDHKRFAERGYFCTGSRAMVCQQRSSRAAGQQRFRPAWYSRGIEHRLNAIRMPWLTPLFHDYKRINGCNMAFWKEDLYAVNGYNEAFVGWGCEDHDIADRLRRLGRKKKHLKFAGIQFHLWHRTNSHNDLEEHQNLLQQNADKQTIRCEQGLES